MSAIRRAIWWRSIVPRFSSRTGRRLRGMIACTRREIRPPPPRTEAAPNPSSCPRVHLQPRSPARSLTACRSPTSPRASARRVTSTAPATIRDAYTPSRLGVWRLSARHSLRAEGQFDARDRAAAEGLRQQRRCQLDRRSGHCAAVRVRAGPDHVHRRREERRRARPAPSRSG